MAKFTIQPHGRLQEWIAHENGYFRAAGLDYEFRGGLSAQRKKEVDTSGKIVDVFSGAFESYQRGKGNKENRIFPARATGQSIRHPPSRSDGCGANPTWSRRAA